MDLQQIVLVLAIIYMTFWMLVAIAALIMGMTFYRRFKDLKKSIGEKGNLLLAAGGLARRLPLKKIAPAVVAMPLVFRLAKKVFHTNNKE